MKHIAHALTRISAVFALVVPLSAGTTGLLSNIPAEAQTATGSLSFVSDPGDYIGNGQSATYSTSSGDRFTVANLSGLNQGLDVSVSASNTDWWELILAAPAGQALVPGTYTGATRYFGNETGPSMSFSGNGAICSTLTGSFTIADVSFGPHGYVTRLDATFVQHCNGADPALTGEVHILNPPPAPVLAPTLTIANDGFAGRVDGQAKIHGSVTCNVPVSLYLNGTVSQVVKKQILTGNFNLTVNCTPGAAQPWSAGASPYVVPFQKGDVVVNASAGAADPNYGDYISVSQSAVVALLWDKQ